MEKSSLNYQILRSIKDGTTIDNIITGGLFIGCGGGGAKEDAETIKKQILDAIEKLETKSLNITNINPNFNNSTELKSGSVVAMMGSPDALVSDEDYTAAERSFKYLSNYLNEKFNFTCAIEVGGVNSLIPILVAAQCSKEKPVSVVDGDGGKRAVPQLELTTYGIPVDAKPLIPIAPTALANDKINSNIKYHIETIIDCEINPDEAVIVEEIARNVLTSSNFGNVCGISFYPFLSKNFSLKLIQKATIYDSLSVTHQVGLNLNKLLNEKESITEYIKKRAAEDSNSALKEIFPTFKIEKIFYGRFNRFVSNDQGLKAFRNSKSTGFDYGTIIIDEWSNPNEQLSIYFENENLIAKDNKKTLPWAMGPDMICYLTDDGPLSNVEVFHLKKGTPIVIFGMRCDEKMRCKYIENGFYNVIKSLEKNSDSGFIPADVIPDSYIPIEKL